MFRILGRRRLARHFFWKFRGRRAAEPKLMAAMEVLENRLVMSAGLSVVDLHEMHVMALRADSGQAQVTAPTNPLSHLVLSPFSIVQQATAITSANSTLFTVGVAGTFTVTTGSTPSDTIVQSGTLPSGVSFTDNGDGTGTLAGTPAGGSAGNYALTLMAKNGGVTQDTQTFTLTVGTIPALTSS